MSKVRGLKFLLLLFFFAAIGSFFNVSSASAASIGQVVSSPESGWRRYGCTQTRYLSYQGGSWVYGGGSDYYTSNTSSRLKFNFYGSKLRLYSYSYSNHTQNAVVNIDGVDYNFRQRNDHNGYYNVLDFGIENLPEKIHHVVVYTRSSLVLSIQAVDVDSTGYILPYVEPVLKLDKTSVTMEDKSSLKLTPAITVYKASDITWSSSDESVAKVDSEGNVYGLRGGTAIITAEVKGSILKAGCTVTVEDKILRLNSEFTDVSLDNTIEVNLVLDNFDGCRSASADIDYDADKLKVMSIEGEDGIRLVKSINKDGNLKICLTVKDKNAVLSRGQRLAKIKFKTLAAGKAELNVNGGNISNKVDFYKSLTVEECGSRVINIK